MFTPADREKLRDELIETARADADVVGAAIVGSVAAGRQDAWSDIDLALQVRGDADPPAVADRWTAAFYASHGAAHHVDVFARGVLYRVFLLASSLQVDVSFWPEDRFQATGPAFSVIFGSPRPPAEPARHDAAQTVGMAWLYALHSRSAVVRGRTWQAVMMLDHLRDQVLTLACLRLGFNAYDGREADLLPRSLLDAHARARATTTAREELTRSHVALMALLGDEVALYDRELELRLAAPFEAISDGMHAAGTRATNPRA